ncbi:MULTISPECIES: TetR/AcrR family transcriptional regulator [unclassified Crossiella]|uniref:TetR/AcrR family transcriptional regulator n=1 Tax=unclassified Crossiella TaxID=2620835 RepID=UPI001FFEDA27|nr:MULTISPECIES: TetR/AcrR family transcriptional regulator [unclassified Crossiella]MCK2241676.1 TetR/AcrR family transcriptional regulator [Crossiella sp. S99.2]MCK2255452.1 TetR/AcrR family transcriptional regulator [Crossiella sp. S99.1]
MGEQPETELLQIGQSPPKERADAARNRLKILAAAAELFERHGVDGVSMDQIAAAAKVGKGTLFRRFGDKAGMAAALLDARERDLQGAIISGPPPLGPGAAAGDRLLAFHRAYAEFLEINLDLVHLSETASPGARYRVGAYRFWHRHVVILLTDARPTLDADYLAHALLAPLAADLRQATKAEFDLKRVLAGGERLVRAVLDGTV